MRTTGRKNNSKRKDNGKTEKHVVHAVWLQQILGEALELIMTTKDTEKLKKTLNSAAWKIKKAVMAEAIETGDLQKANAIATYILNLTEVKKAAIAQQINVNENVRILMEEIVDVPYELLEQRADQLREIKRLGVGADRAGDDAAVTREVLLVEDEAVSKRSS